LTSWNLGSFRLPVGKNEPGRGEAARATFECIFALNLHAAQAFLSRRNTNSAIFSHGGPVLIAAGRQSHKACHNLTVQVLLRHLNFEVWWGLKRKQARLAYENGIDQCAALSRTIYPIDTFGADPLLTTYLYMVL
jgi:hypothetical protein